MWGLKEGKWAIHSLQAPPCLPVFTPAIFQGRRAGGGQAAPPSSLLLASQLMEPTATDPSLCSQARPGQIKQRGRITELGLLSTLPWRTIFLQTLQGKSNALLC